jgi:hypothetical protein
MARGHPIELATQTFRTKDLANEFFKEMLGRYRSGERVGDDDGLHLSALLERHDEYRQKVGCGVSHFSVMTTEYGTPCFVINRHDGTSTDFSYRHCVSQRPPTRKQEVSQALRRVVRFDLYAARDKFFAEHRNEEGCVACAETGELITID